MEKKLFMTGIVITVAGFITTWTPYAIVFFISVFRGKEGGVDPLATFICACFAKSSVVWIPLLYISTSTNFKFHFVNLSSINKEEQTSAHHPAAQHSSTIHRNCTPTMQIATINLPVDKPFSSID